MNKFTKLLIISLAAGISCIYAQPVSYSVSSALRYGNGYENAGEGGFVSRNRKKYFDYYSDARVFYSRFAAGVRLEYTDPPEYSLVKKGITSGFIEYTGGDISIRLGNSFSLFGRGMALNLFENRPLAFNSMLSGIKGSLRLDDINLTAIHGKINFTEPSTVMSPSPYEEEYLLSGGNIEYKLYGGLSAGHSYINSKSEHPGFLQRGILQKAGTEILESYIKLNTPAFDFFFNYAYKSTLPAGGNEASGFGYYSSLSYSRENFGLSFEYKNYYFDAANPLRRLEAYRSTRFLPFQNAPTGIREHSFTLPARSQHLVDFNDETGVQIEVYYLLADNTTATFNVSAASRHNDYSFDWTEFEMKRQNDGFRIFPSFDSRYSPFYEIYAEIESYFSGSQDYFKAGAGRRSDITFDPVNLTQQVQPQNSTSLVFMLQYQASDKIGTKSSAEAQWQRKYPHAENLFTGLLNLQFIYLQDFTVGIRLEGTDSVYEPDEKKFWAACDFSYRFRPGDMATLTYGEERGGQICSSGLCRQVLPFSGLRLSVVSNIN